MRKRVNQPSAGVRLSVRRTRVCMQTIKDQTFIRPGNLIILILVQATSHNSKENPLGDSVK